MSAGIFKTAQNLKTKEAKGLGRSKTLLRLFSLLIRPCGSMQNSELTRISLNMGFLKGKAAQKVLVLSFKVFSVVEK